MNRSAQSAIASAILHRELLGVLARGRRNIIEGLVVRAYIVIPHLRASGRPAQQPVIPVNRNLNNQYHDVSSKYQSSDNSRAGYEPERFNHTANNSPLRIAIHGHFRSKRHCGRVQRNQQCAQCPWCGRGRGSRRRRRLLWTSSDTEAFQRPDRSASARPAVTVRHSARAAISASRRTSPPKQRPCEASRPWCGKRRQCRAYRSWVCLCFQYYIVASGILTPAQSSNKARDFGWSSDTGTYSKEPRSLGRLHHQSDGSGEVAPASNAQNLQRQHMRHSIEGQGMSEENVIAALDG